MTDRFDDAIARLLSDQDTGPGGSACPDADTLGAFYERSLSSSERVSTETHLARCGRCQAHLAGLVGTDPERLAAPDAAGPDELGWRRLIGWLDWRWIAPTAAMGVLVIAVWGIDPGTAPVLQPQRAEDTAGNAAIEREADASVADAVAPARPSPFRRRQTAPESVAGEAPSERSMARASSAAPEPRAAPEEMAAPWPTGVPDEMTAPEPTGAPEEMAALGPRAAPEATATPATAVAAVTVETVEAARSILVSSPSGRSTWRFGADEPVEYSGDRGASWSRQLGAEERLVGGSAPSDAVCWLAGRNGTIFRTVDRGITWETLTPWPGREPVRIIADDAGSATIRFTDGSVTMTEDGGVTWTTP